MHIDEFVLCGQQQEQIVAWDPPIQFGEKDVTIEIQSALRVEVADPQPDHETIELLQITGVPVDVNGSVGSTDYFHTDKEGTPVTLTVDPDANDLRFIQWTRGVNVFYAEGETEIPLVLLQDATFTAVFERDEPRPDTEFRRGDCDGDGRVPGQINDAFFLLSYLFQRGVEPPCLAACDANGDGNVVGTVSDAVFLLSYLFLGTQAPPPPLRQCGPGTSADEELGCETAPKKCS